MPLSPEEFDKGYYDGLQRNGLLYCPRCSGATVHQDAVLVLVFESGYSGDTFKYAKRLMVRTYWVCSGGHKFTYKSDKFHV